jgi:hypothetical protein
MMIMRTRTNKANVVLWVLQVLLGGFGLIVPGLLRRHRELTPLAAIGLGIIMIGATATTVANFGIEAAILPLITGVVAAIVAYGRWDALAVAH